MYLLFIKKGKSDPECFLHGFIAIPISEWIDSTVQKYHVEFKWSDNRCNMLAPIQHELKQKLFSSKIL